MITFDESGLTFEFKDDDCYIIENDPLIANSQCASTSNNMACECISIIDSKHVFIEVKSSAPRGASANIKKISLDGKPLPENWIVYDNYKNFLRQIAKKFIDSFQLLKSFQEGNHGSQRLAALHNVGNQLKRDNLQFVLILNLNIPEDKKVDMQVLSNLQDSLKNEMRPFLKIWNIPDISVKVALPESAKSKLKIPIISN